MSRLCGYNACGRRTRRKITDLRGATPTTEDVRFVYDQWYHLIAEYYYSGAEWNLWRKYVNYANVAVHVLTKPPLDPVKVGQWILLGPHPTRRYTGSCRV